MARKPLGYVVVRHPDYKGPEHKDHKDLPPQLMDAGRLYATRAEAEAAAAGRRHPNHRFSVESVGA